MLSRLGLALILLLPGGAWAAETPFASQAAGVQFLGKTPWFDTGTRKGFGGFSGLEVSADGARFWAVNDNALIVTGRFVRDNVGITALEVDPIEALKYDSDRPIWADREGNDAEGLAMLPDGRYLVSFEGRHRISLFGPDRRASDVPGAPDFDRFEVNGGLEALAVDDQGWIYALPERSGQVNRPFPVYRGRDGVWDTPFSLDRSAGFLPVGADFGPDGAFYLLERAFPGYGFKSRVRRIVFDETTILSDEVLFVSKTGAFDNLEGLSAWRDGQGNIRLTLLSDDNYKWFQQTQFVEILIAE